MCDNGFLTEVKEYRKKPAYDIEDSSIGDDVMTNISEWSSLVTELSKNEISLYHKKEDYENASEKLLEEAKNAETDPIKAKYGANNDKVRKKYVKEMLIEENKEIKNLEFSIDYLKRRISFIKQLIHTKTVLLEVKE